MLLKRVFFYNLLILFINLFSLSSSFSGTTCKIAGRVIDAETGEPLIGVNVIIENTNMGAATDAEGEFFIINIPDYYFDIIFMAFFNHFLINCLIMN